MVPRDRAGVTATVSRSTAAFLCRHWVALYTRNLPAAEQQDRRSEIESDLYEHALEARDAGVGSGRLNSEILARVLVGVPADLSWRRATRQPSKRLNLGGTQMSLPKSNANRALNILGTLIIIYAWSAPVAMASFWLFSDVPETDVSVLMRTFFIVVPAVASIALAIGLKIRSHSPRRGMHLIVAGVMGPAVWLWFLPIYGPVMIAVIALAVSVTPRKNASLAVT
jgi:hypothetical protein